MQLFELQKQHLSIAGITFFFSSHQCSLELWHESCLVQLYERKYLFNQNDEVKDLVTFVSVKNNLKAMDASQCDEKSDAGTFRQTPDWSYYV